MPCLAFHHRSYCLAVIPLPLLSVYVLLFCLTSLFLIKCICVFSDVLDAALRSSAPLFSTLLYLVPLYPSATTICDDQAQDGYNREDQRVHDILNTRWCEYHMVANTVWHYDRKMLCRDECSIVPLSYVIPLDLVAIYSSCLSSLNVPHCISHCIP